MEMVRVDASYSKHVFIQKSFVISHHFPRITKEENVPFRTDMLCEFVLPDEKQCSLKSGKSS